MKRILAFIIVAVHFIFCWAQPDVMTFNNLNTDMGLSHGDVLCICQDFIGYTWIGTADGLNRFDGIEFTVYRFNKNDSNSLSNSYINTIYEDKLNNLWIGTSGGLCRYNRNLNNFERIDFDNGQISKTDLSVTKIFEDNSNRLWIGCGIGVYLYDRNTRRFTVCFENTFNPDSLIYCTGIDQDIQGNMWFSFKDAKNVGIIKYKPETMTTTWYDAKYSKIRLKENSVYSLLIDNQNNVWIGYVSEGIDVIHEQKNTISNFQKNTKANSLNCNSIFSLAQNSEGKILIGTNGGGLNIYDPKTGLFNHYTKSESDWSLLSNAIQVLYVGNDGMIWIGCRAGGVSMYDKRYNKFIHFKHQKDDINSLYGSSVTCFAEDLNGIIWIATDGGGINLFDPSDYSFKNFRSDNRNNNTLTNDKVLALETDSKGGLWAGMWQGGLNYFQIDGNSLTLKKRYNSVSEEITNSNSIFTIYSDKNGDLWVGTFSSGAYLYDPVTAKFNSVPLEDTESKYLNFIIRDILCDYKNEVWFATQRDGLIKYKRSTGGDDKIFYFRKDSFGLPSNSINVLHEDTQKRLWIGTDEEGLCLYNRNTNSFSRFSTDDGLPNNTIVGILEDDHGNLWISSNNGISKATIYADDGYIKMMFRNYSIQDGLQSKIFNRWAYFKSSTGKMYFGGINGFNMFHPDSIKDNMIKPPVQITDFLLFNEPVVIGEKTSPLKKHISETKKLILNFNQSLFTFRFVALNYILSEKNQYAYMMEGIDKDWNNVGTERRATYSNLKPDEYTFRVKASNNDGIWNEEGTSIRVIILPPWWQSLWFKIALVIIILSASISFYRIRLNNLKKEQQLLEVKIKRRTNELSEANALLKEKQEEITLQNEELSRHRNHLENLVMERTTELEEAKKRAEESDRLKSSFLANMSHEIRTPMNAIVGFSSLICDEDVSASERTEYAEVIKDNSDTLLVLIDDIIEVSLIEADQIRIINSHFAASSILLQLENYFSLKNSKGIDFHYTNKNDKNELFLFNDPIRFRQVFSNLISNAFKYTETGCIRYGYEILDNQVQFYVSDTGLGINKADFKNIFNYFHKIEKENTKIYPGAGIGLSICKKLIELMGGKIWLDSEPGKGSTFYFTLPYSSENMRSSPKETKKYKKVYDLKNLKILVAEDEPNNFKLIEKILKPTGAKVIWASNGRQAVDHISQQSKLDDYIVLMDIKMPVMNGIQANIEIKKIRRDIPVIAVTAYASDKDKEEILKNDFSDYIVKPLIPRQFLEIIGKYAK